MGQLLLKKFINLFAPKDLKINVCIPAKTRRTTGMLNGSLMLNARCDHSISTVHLKLTENWSIGRGTEKFERSLILTEKMIDETFELKQGETKLIVFTVCFETLNSKNDRLKEKGGWRKALGMVSSFFEGEKSEFIFSATAETKNGLCSNEEVKVKLEH